MIEAAAVLLLLVLFWLLAKGFSARFLRIWMAGWSVYACFAACQLISAWQPRLPIRMLSLELSFGAAVLFFSAVLEFANQRKHLRWIWPLAAIVSIGLQADFVHSGQPVSGQWTITILKAALYLAGGWLLWRSPERKQGHGVLLLAPAMILVGLNGLDAPNWPAQALQAARLSFNGVFVVAMGIAMAVLVLEAGRARTEDLNEKLRRLSLITSAATQSFRVEEVIDKVLKHVSESLNESHGFVRLLDLASDPAMLVLRGVVGFGPDLVKENDQIPANAAWAVKTMEQGIPSMMDLVTADLETRKWMKKQGLRVMLQVRIPGKDAPLGILGVGSGSHRLFQADEIDFLNNVSNLLGLTLQNVLLFEEAASAQRQWAYTFDSIDDLILVHDRDCRVIRANRRLAAQLGGSPDKIEGKFVCELLRRGDSRWTGCPYCEGTAGKPETADPSFGGYFLATNSDFHDPAGKPLGTIHVLKDFADRREAETKFRTLFQNLREGVFISTPEGRFVDFNDAFMRMLGYESRDELIHSEIAPTFYADPADRDRLKRILKDCGEAVDFEFRLRRRDGEIRTVTESSFATRDAAGAVTAYNGYVLDVTERKHAEQEIRRRNRELMTLNQIAQVLGQSVDCEEVLNRVIRQIVELFGADLGSIYLLDEETCVIRRVAATGFLSEYGSSFPSTVLSREMLDHVRQVRASLLSPKSLPLPEVFRDLERKEKIEDSRLSVLWAKDRIIGGLEIGCRTRREFSGADLSLLAAVGNQVATEIDKSVLYRETRQAYENLRRTQEQLLQSEKMAAVGQLISGVAHELNNPLTAILGYSQLLSSSEHVSARGSDYLQKLYKQALRTHRIVQNLLSFARQQKPERLPVQVNQIIEDTLALREYDLKLNNISVHREFDADLPLTSGDSHQLQQVFLNILNNAVDAVLEVSGRGDIWARTSVEDGHVCIEFSDSGPGVEDSLRVFDPFYTTKAVGKGTGLGLSICYGIIKEHGGEIRVRNAPPRGASFSILLPPYQAESQESAPRQASSEQLGMGHVLLVDDEESVLELEQEILRGRCREIYVARSGKEAIQALQTHAIDVVVTDMKMPGEISGADIHEWIEEHRPDLSNRVVFTMSNSRAEDSRLSLKNSGCQAVQKPFRIEDFLNAIRNALALVPQDSLRR